MMKGEFIIMKIELDTLKSEFKALDTIQEKIEFLEFWKSQNLPYDIKWDNTINAWRNKILS